MGDVAKGIKSFKKNIKDDEKPEDAAMTAENAPPAPPAGNIAAPQQGTQARAEAAETTAGGRPAA